MERIDVVARAAHTLRARIGMPHAQIRAAELVSQLCAKLSLAVAADGSQTMLGGAYARLQLFAAAQPEIGGIIWVSDALGARERAFAIAHELGHYALHRGEATQLHKPCDERQIDPQADAGSLRIEQHRVEEYSPRVRRELEANAFAGELLAPRGPVRRFFATHATADAPALATAFGISNSLAQRRLIDAVLAPAPDAPDDDALNGRAASTTTGTAADTRTPTAVLVALDESQRAAATAPGPVLVVAGPGTGKTATLVGRVAHLVCEQGEQPERVLALTFSNRAAGEMRDRLERSGLPGARMPVMTIHAFAADLLRRYAGKVPHGPDEAVLRSDFRILDQADTFLLIEELLADLRLHYYRSLGNPTAHVRTLIEDFSQARDQLLAPADYLKLVEHMPPMPPAPGGDAEHATTAPSRKPRGGHTPPPAGTFTPEQIARARERALAYRVWDRALRQRGLLDFGGLIQRAVELLRADAQVLADVRAKLPHVLIDEFQDTNHAAGELVLLVAGEQGRGLWVVGDRNQSIYRWRGASPGNLARLAERYPRLAVHTLRINYRSVPAVVALGSSLAASMHAASSVALEARPDAGASPGNSSGMNTSTGAATFDQAARVAAVLRTAMRPTTLLPNRTAGNGPAVVREERFTTADQESAGLGLAIRREYAAGRAYDDLAILCRGHRQAARVAGALAAEGLPVALAAEGLPVALPGDFFERPEIKDVLAYIALAAGPDARGVLRADALLLGLGQPVADRRQLASLVQSLALAHHTLPGALSEAALAEATDVSPRTRGALARLGEAAQSLRRASSIGVAVATYLLRAGGYAWRLVRVADGLDAHAADDLSACWSTGEEPGQPAPARADAQTALTALGEVVRLAFRFDARWANEPDFQRRLSRAVSHWHGTGAPAQPSSVLTSPMPSAADALEPPPGADMVAEAPADATAPAVSCLLHYVHALRAADVAITLPAGASDAVRVMTVHASKGLEFPVVFLPGLADGQFPSNRHGPEVVCPPGFRELDTPGEHAAEERCIFYVGLTRARDTVVLTRAGSYNQRTRTRTPRGPSPLLALLDAAPEWRQASPLCDEATLASLPSQMTDADDEADEEEDEATQAGALAPPQRLAHPADARVYTLSALETYVECPRKYKYAEWYRLLDPANSAVARFHRYVRSGRRVLREVHAAQPQANWDHAEARLLSHWQAEGPAGHAYDAFYWQRAQAILRDEWQALCSEAAQDPSARMTTTIAETLEVRLRGCRVRTMVDRVEHEAPATSGVVRLVRQHTGRPHKDDANDLCLSLYYLGYRQQHPTSDVRIELTYAGDGLAGDPTAVPAPGRGEAIDVTEQARREAERYEQSGGTGRSKLNKLDRAAASIAAGRFEPRPSESRCATCAFRTICPADPAALPMPPRAASAASPATPAPTGSR